jgi:hypothetical protein
MESTGSRKIDALIATAEKSGLTAVVTIEDEAWLFDQTIRRVSVEFQRPRLGREPENMLEVIRQHDAVVASWQWVRRNGNTPKMYYAIRRYYSIDPQALTATGLKYAIDSLAH